jgi:hypothetical protein
LVPGWVWLANYSLDFLMKTLQGYGFKLWIESETVSRHLEERYEQSLTPLQFDKALPGFGDLLERPPLRLGSFDSGKRESRRCSCRAACTRARRLAGALLKPPLVRRSARHSPARGWAPKRV